MAAWPPEEVVTRLESLARRPLAGLRWTTAAQWHVTLRFLGRVDDPPAVAAALRSVPLPGATAALGPAVARFDRSVLHVAVAGLDDLAASVASATSHLGEAAGPRPFTGHVTLARAGRRARLDLRPLTGQRVEARWAVGEITVVASHLERGGARYEVLDRIALPLLGG